MGLRMRPLLPVVLGFTVAVGCAHKDPYPPAVPWIVKVPFDNSPLIPAVAPPPELAWKPPTPTLSPAASLVPTADEWRQWQVKTPAKTICRGKGRRRTCQASLAPTAIDEANTGAVVRASALHTAGGTSGQVRYPYDMQRERIYEIVTSPAEATYLLMPEGERQAIRLVLNPSQWEVSNGKNGSEGTRREVLVVRPVEAPLTARSLLVFQSGLTISLKLIAQERPGMLSVTWDLPEGPPTPAEVPIEKQPPRFDKALAYAGYQVTLEGKAKQHPAWFPEAVIDDGHNTLIKLPGTMDGIRFPVVQGIQQTGKPALVQSRVYVRPDHGAWLYVQGLWPALQMQDGAGMRVKIVRQSPPQRMQEETRYGQALKY